MAIDEKKEIYQQKAQAEFDKLNAQLEELKAKAAKAEADTKLRYQNSIESLQAKSDAAQSKLEEIQASSEAAWEDLQSGFEVAWNDLKAAFDKAVSNFQ
ncbi:MAG TPA: hypothetical protein ACFE0H_13670 [Elainellaceae cyanobacterium]